MEPLQGFWNVIIFIRNRPDSMNTVKRWLTCGSWQPASTWSFRRRSKQLAGRSSDTTLNASEEIRGSYQPGQSESTAVEERGAPEEEGAGATNHEEQVQQDADVTTDSLPMDV